MAGEYHTIKGDQYTALAFLGGTFDHGVDTIQTSGQWADLAVFCCGLVSGLGASVVTQPADVIKTRVQLTSTLATGGASVSLTNAIGLIYQVWWGREGPLG